MEDREQRAGSWAVVPLGPEQVPPLVHIRQVLGDQEKERREVLSVLGPHFLTTYTSKARCWVGFVAATEPQNH